MKVILIIIAFVLAGCQPAKPCSFKEGDAVTTVAGDHSGQIIDRWNTATGDCRYYVRVFAVRGSIAAMMEWELKPHHE